MCMCLACVRNLLLVVYVHSVHVQTTAIKHICTSSLEVLFENELKAVSAWMFSCSGVAEMHIWDTCIIVCLHVMGVCAYSIVLATNLCDTTCRYTSQTLCVILVGNFPMCTVYVCSSVCLYSLYVVFFCFRASTSLMWTVQWGSTSLQSE